MIANLNKVNLSRFIDRFCGMYGMHRSKFVLWCRRCCVVKSKSAVMPISYA
jgi:hypothetical protein